MHVGYQQILVENNLHQSIFWGKNNHGSTEIEITDLMWSYKLMIVEEYQQK